MTGWTGKRAGGGAGEGHPAALARHGAECPAGDGARLDDWFAWGAVAAQVAALLLLALR